jgi:beta-phosphoglucomutase
MPGLVDLLDRADAMGWLRAVVTNAPRDNAEAMLAAIGLRQRFETVIIGDECARGKPDPAPYLAGMQALGVGPDRCIAFEDSPSGITAAAASGALTVGVRSSLDDTALRRAGADASIADFADPILPGLLARLDTAQGAPTA